MNTKTIIETATSSLRGTTAAKNPDHTYQCLWLGSSEMGDHAYYLPLAENLSTAEELRHISKTTMIAPRELLEVAALNSYLIDVQDRLFAEALAYSDDIAGGIIEMIHESGGTGDSASHIYSDDLVSKTVAPMAKAMCTHATMEYMNAGSIPDAQLRQRLGAEAHEALEAVKSEDDQSPGM